MVEVKLKNDKLIYGDASYVDYAKAEFWLLGQDDVGMVGQKVGTCIRFTDCVWVRVKLTPNGPFEGDVLSDWARVAQDWREP